ncbi:lantibiotic dehydratase [Priestia megaterium]|uniref:lantibiotic dehydratase n=1 Tax=Priestia megaterium TaxID=1404 RepID=UPI00286233AA|nr:lantibiotic dehydratase [Priestia megaterium]MDR7246884.1 hypothetical protein [Priestia megaterium]
MIKLFPNFIIRAASVPMEKLECLKMNETISFVNRLESIENNIQNSVANICDELFALIKLETDEYKKKILLNLKRDIYNQRNISYSYEHLLDIELNEKIDKWKLFKQEAAALKEQIEFIFQEELLEKRTSIQELANLRDLQRAIPLSTETLHKKWKKYLSVPVNEQNKKLRKIERSILLYLTRTIAKTSPFSSLTLIGGGEFTEFSSEKSCSLSWESDVHSNNMVGIYIWELLIKSSLSTYFPLEINSSYRVVTSDKKYIEFVKVDRHRINSKFLEQKEKSVKMPYDNGIDSLCKFIEQTPFINFSLLKEKILESNKNSNADILIKKLMEIDLIRFKTPFAEQDTDYIDKIINYLENMNKELKENSLSIEICSIMKKFKSIIHQGLGMDSNRIEETLKLLNGYLDNLVTKLDGKIEEINPIIYEDCYIKSLFELPEEKFSSFIKDVSSIEPLYVLFDTQVPVKIFIHKVFLELQQGENKINLLTFQNYIQTIISKFDSDFMSYIINYISDQPLYHEWNSLRSKFYNNIFNMIDMTNEEFTISKKLLDELKLEMSDNLRAMSTKSWSYFIQPLTDGNFVVNKLSDGNGKFMSRFMRGLSEKAGLDFSNSTLNYIEKTLNEPSVITELNGVFGFNANIHPSIAPYELQYPGVGSRKRDEKLINPENVSVSISQEGNIVLYSNDLEKKIELFYIQFLNLKLVPPLFRFLIYFSHLSNPHISLNENLFLNENVREKEIVYFPRLKVGNTIFERRQWWIKTDSFLKENNKDNNGLERFLNMRRWFKEHSIPRKFYLRANLSLQSTSEMKPAPYQDAMRKPQYIDIDSFHLCQVFFNQIAVMKEGFIVEEALPDIETLDNQFFEKKHMVELLIETYNVEE